MLEFWMLYKMQDSIIPIKVQILSVEQIIFPI